jgi:hypothetical protein
MCGLVNLFGNYVGEVLAVGAEWTDDQGRTGGLSEYQIEITAVTPEGIERLGRRPRPDSPTVASTLLSSSSDDSTLGKLLEVLGYSPLSWGSIYNLYELLHERVGLKGLAALSGVSERRLKALRRSANTHRHATARSGPSFQPIPLDDAALLICHLVQRWVALKVET